MEKHQTKEEVEKLLKGKWIRIDKSKPDDDIDIYFYPKDEYKGFEEIRLLDDLKKGVTSERFEVTETLKSNISNPPPTKQTLVIVSVEENRLEMVLGHGSIICERLS